MHLPHFILIGFVIGLSANDEARRFFGLNGNDNTHRIRSFSPQFGGRHNRTRQTLKFNSTINGNNKNDPRIRLSDWLYRYKLTTPKSRIRSQNVNAHKTTKAQKFKAALDKLTRSIDALSSSVYDLRQTFIKTRRGDLERYTDVNGHRSKRSANGTDNASIVVPLNGTDKINSRVDKADAKIDCPETNVSRRRSMYPKTGLVKDKLLLYLEEGFRDVEDKVVSLEQLKQFYLNVVPYKVGYIVANIDTLVLNMRNLREDVRMKGNAWGEKEILDVYDRLKMSNSLINNLLNSLRMFARND